MLVEKPAQCPRKTSPKPAQKNFKLAQITAQICDKANTLQWK